MRMRLTFPSYHNILIALFCLCIGLPSVAMFYSKPRIWSETEKRVLAPPPNQPTSFSELVPFFSSLDNYLSDHFGFRDFFLHRYQRELKKRFGKSSMHPHVIEGLDGWYFYNHFDLFQDFLGQRALTEDQLRKWLDQQQKKQNWLKKHNIKYLYIVAPNKHSIYPNYLMKNSMELKGVSRYEQLSNYIEGKFPEYQINLHPILQSSRHTSPLYYKNDSHWNKLGAYLAFQAIFDRISQWFPEEKFITNFEFAEDQTGIGGNTGEGGDLVRLIRQQQITETYPEIQNFPQCGSYTVDIPYPLSNVRQQAGTYSFTRSCPKRNLKAVIFRDSFFVPLEPFFSENFAETIYLWKGYDQQNIIELLEYLTPDIVIEEVVERHAFDTLQTKDDQ